MKRIVLFARRLPTNVRLCGGVINPWLWHTVKATWNSTGPPPPPIELTDDEWASFEEALREL